MVLKTQFIQQYKITVMIPDIWVALNLVSYAMMLISFVDKIVSVFWSMSAETWGLIVVTDI